jgi:hypothetical protein
VVGRQQPRLHAVIGVQVVALRELALHGRRRQRGRGAHGLPATVATAAAPGPGCGPLRDSM